MGYVSDFSPDGKFFALLDTDNRLKIWDVGYSRLVREFIPNIQLDVPYTCFVWFSSAAGVVADGKRKRNVETTLYIALGTSKGGVDLYSHATDKIESRLKGNRHAGGVTSICLHNESTLYTSGKDCTIVEWSLINRCWSNSFSIGTIVPTCIVSLPISNTLLVGCKELHLWSLDDEKPKLISKLRGHSSDVQSMKVLAEGKKDYVVTTAKSNREIYLWQIGSKIDDAPKATFLMEYAASFLSFSCRDEKFMIAAVTGADRTAAGGVVHLFSYDIRKDSSKKQKPPAMTSIKPPVTLSVAFDSKNVRGIVPIPIIAATSNFSNPQNILIGYGSSPTLHFENIQYNSEKKQTITRDDPRTQVGRQEKAKELSNTMVPITNDSNTQYHSGALKSKGQKRSLDKTSSKSLGDRLKAVSIPTDNDEEGHSLVETLKQVLHSNDDKLIRQVLNIKEDSMIRSTLKRLPAHYVPMLTDHLTRLTHQKTANVQIAVKWFTFLLQIHASQLMALGRDELNDRFGSLLGILEQRTNTLVQLSGLSGRLNALVEQIHGNTLEESIYNDDKCVIHFDDEDDDNVDGDGGSGDEDIEMANGDDDDSNDSDSVDDS